MEPSAAADGGRPADLVGTVARIVVAGGHEAHRGHRHVACRPQAHRGLLLDLTPAAEHRHASRAHEAVGGQRGPDGGGDVLERTEVGAGHEHHGHVGPRPERVEERADHLARGVGGEGVLGERGGDLHVGGGAAGRPAQDTGASRVYGTTITGPRSMRQ